MKKILHITSGDVYGGAESQLVSLMAGFSHQRSDYSHVVLLFNKGELSQKLEKLGVHTIILSELDLSFVGLVRKVRHSVSSLSPDVVHVHNYKESVLAMLCLPGTHFKLVRTLHGWPEIQWSIKRLFNIVVRLVDITTTRFITDKVVLVSPQMVKRAHQLYGKSKCVVVENGIEIEGEAGVRNEATKGPVRVGFVGRLVSVKRLDLFLQIANKLSADNRFQFKIYGDGPLSYEIDEARLVNVSYYGKRPTSQIYPEIDVLLICSDSEGLPMVLLEALANRVIVLARQVGGIPYVVQNRKNGFLVDSEEPNAYIHLLREIALDPTGGKELKENGYKTIATDYSMETCAAQYSKLYNNLYLKSGSGND